MEAGRGGSGTEGGRKGKEWRTQKRREYQLEDAAKRRKRWWWC